MKKRAWFWWGVAGVAAAAGAIFAAGRGGWRGGGEGEPAVVEIGRGPLTVWTLYEGKIESRNVDMIMAKIGGGSLAVIELAPEGAFVRKGEVMARLDAAKNERDLAKFEMDYTLAKADYESLVHAQHPLQLRELDSQIGEAQSGYDDECRFLEDSRPLLEEDLISQQELDQQSAKVEQLKGKLENLKLQLKLTREFLHPGAVEAAKAKMETARLSADLARQDVEACTLRAPSDGLLSYLPVHLSGEFRTVRVGDSIYRNQAFMAIPAMSNLVAHCYAPESELSRVAKGMAAIVRPPAFPGLCLTGRVESIGAMAQTVYDKPNWQKYFHVVVALEGGDDRLRSGMSAGIAIQSYDTPDAVLIPRAAVKWEGGKPWCRVRAGHREDRRDLILGAAGEAAFEVLNGLKAGEKVVLP